MQSDHERPLAPRGQRAVVLLHEYVRQARIEPQLVLCSTARRAVETLQATDPGGELSLEPHLYGASAAELLTRLHAVDDAVEEVLVVGHNPALQMLILKLVADTRCAELSEIRRKFPTGGLVTLSFSGPWATLAPAGATLSAYSQPKVMQYS